MTLHVRLAAAVLLAALAAPALYAQEPVKEKAMAAQNPVVIMETSEGPITLELFADKAPKTVENFLAYVDDGFYDGLIFHRVIENFMIQGGGFTPDMRQKATKPAIRNEARADVKNKRGTIAMARTSELHSATAQFFINVVDNDFLDHSGETAQTFGYAVFGRVIDGMNVVDKIKSVRTGVKGGMRDVPVEPVVIKSVKRAEAKEGK